MMILDPDGVRVRKLVLVTVVLAACGGGDPSSPVDVGPSTPTPDPVVLVPTTIDLSPEFLLLDGVGDTATVTAEVRDQNGAVVDSATVTWAMAVPSVAGVNAPGLVLANAVGVSAVEARSGSLFSSIPVIVTTAGDDAVNYLTGDTLLGALTATAEVDTISFALTEGDEFQVYLQSFADRVDLLLRTPDGAFNLAELSHNQGQSGGLPDVSDRITIALPGIYALIVTHRELQLTRPTAYSVWSYRVNHAPEFTGPTFAIGDTVRGETLERPIADVDEFQVAIDSSDVVQVRVRYLDESAVPRLWVGLGPVGNDPQYWSPQTGTADWQGLATVDLRFFSEWDPGEYAFSVTVLKPDEAGPAPLGGYEFLLQPINRAPESVAASFSIGDTVRGETIDDPVGGDRDEFSVTLAEGDRVSVYFNSLGFDPDNRLQMLFFGPTGGQDLFGLQSSGADNGVTSDPRRVAAGTHYLWVYGKDGISDSGPYEFAIILVSP